MEKIKLILKGFIVGLGKIIPGVSGGMLAISLGIYEEATLSLAHFFKDVKKSSVFLGLLGIGMIFAIVTMSGVIEFCLVKYYLPTMLLFIGLMLGGFSSIKKEVQGTSIKDYFWYCFIPFVLMMVLQYTQSSQTFIYDGSVKSVLFLFLFGVIDAVTMIVPGVSGTAILMLLGCYTMLLETFSHLFDVSMLATTLHVLVPFSCGVLIGVFITIKIVSYFIEKHSISFYYMILSFFMSSVFLLFLQTLKRSYSFFTIFVSFICFVIGYFISKFLDLHYNS